ncbi:hypothetical protein TRQ7_05030 [Thermotoga sp. RQ7]|uniref:DUF192 domain-containing protein n=1 Tax=Thermotoga neapolitana (strain ATCC 49049 / DSM 4359 / NBRC 107923 / NS-E) TaxID=309803 RepID=B9K7G2_THENN|nr:DUF192 domain-containing protein [Thermotoga sp. RQ7]ACM22895.1 Putative uncharacterized protein precursor [Thermotoga neapolitana DSM 4359]AJG40817.1 hypothetical protein TRQ7_05030 [Thermotoga sp. RQ7]
MKQSVKFLNLRRLLLLALIAAGISVIIVVSNRENRVKFPEGEIVITDGERSLKLRVEIANTPFFRSIGLMYRKSIPDDFGMLFVFEEDTRSGFWMKNTYVPLEIAFIDRNGIVFSIQEMEPCEKEPCKVYYAPKPFRYALEVKRGFFERHGFGVGSRVLIEK